MIKTTSRKKMTHSVNHPQKKTRMRLPMASGLTRAVVNQMPTPVMAPSEVVTTKMTKVIL